MVDTKAWYTSKTIWGAILAGIAPIAGVLLHHAIPSDLVPQLADGLAALGGALAIVGRMVATSEISTTKG